MNTNAKFAVNKQHRKNAGKEAMEKKYQFSIVSMQIVLTKRAIQHTNGQHNKNKNLNHRAGTPGVRA